MHKGSNDYDKQTADAYFQAQKEKISQIKKLQNELPYKPAFTAKWFQPIFNRFSRSGTTLLDTILRTHSQIDVVEEQPLLDKVKKSLGDIKQFLRSRKLITRQQKLLVIYIF